MIQTDMLPISVVDGKGFRGVINLLEPAYHIPSRRTITRLIETQYEELKQKLLNELATADRVAVTTDYTFKLWPMLCKRIVGLRVLLEINISLRKSRLPVVFSVMDIF